MVRGSDHILLIGCGSMGAALLSGWLRSGHPPRHISVIDPEPSPWLTSLTSIGVSLNSDLCAPVDAVVIAVPEHGLAAAISSMPNLAQGADPVFVSLLFRSKLDTLEQALGKTAPAIVRAMPNMAGKIGAGVTALAINAHAGRHHLQLADRLMSPLGETLLLANENQLNAVAAISGCGPAYVSAFSEALTHGGLGLGLPRPIAERLASSVVSGCGQAIVHGDANPTETLDNYRANCAPSAAGLARLQSEKSGLDMLIRETTEAAYDTFLKCAIGKP